MLKIAIAVLTVALTSGAATAASIQAKCESAKQLEAGKLRACLHGAEKKRVTSGDPVAYGAAVAKCTTSFAAKWQKAEQKALDQGAACPSMGDEGAVRTAITAHVGCLASELATGDTTCLTCGDGVIDAGEDCDLGTLGGATCASASGGTLDIGTVGCSADCSFDMSACATCPGELVGGHCWLLGAPGASCDTTCTANGLAYDPATWFYAGSNGTNAQCGAVLDALGAAPGSITNTSVGGAGCFYTAGMTRIRDSRTTTSSYGTGTLRRACACE